MTKEKQKSKTDQNHQLPRELAMAFPASHRPVLANQTAAPAQTAGCPTPSG
jgi:hypothetical protein